MKKTIKTALKQFSNAETEMRKLAREAGRKLDEKGKRKEQPCTTVTIAGSL